MAFKTVTFDLTAASTGIATDTAKLPIAADRSRPAFIEAVSFDDTDSFKQPYSFTIHECDSSYDPNNQLFYIRGSMIPAAQIGPDQTVVASMVFPREFVDNEEGEVTTVRGRRIPIRTPYLVARVEGATSGDILVVKLFFETAGDQRF